MEAVRTGRQLAVSAWKEAHAPDEVPPIEPKDAVGVICQAAGAGGRAVIFRAQLGVGCLGGLHPLVSFTTATQKMLCLVVVFIVWLP